MEWVQAFIEGLKTVATSPYAFVAYVCLLAGFIYWLMSESRLNAIARLPVGEQAAVLEKEYRVLPRAGLSGDQWIRARRITLTFWAFVVLIVAIVLLGTIGLLTLKPTTPIGTPTGTTAADTTKTPTGGNKSVVVPPLDIPPIVSGGAPIGTKFQNRYLKDNTSCMGETVKVSATEWQERNSSDSPAGCGEVLFEYTERESSDPKYFLLYDEGRNLYARLPNIPVGQTGPSDWRQIPSPIWNAGRSLTRVN
jgi:hypothetical protein